MCKVLSTDNEYDETVIIKKLQCHEKSLSFHCDFLAKEIPKVSIRWNTNAEMTHQAQIKHKVKKNRE